MIQFKAQQVSLDAAAPEGDAPKRSLSGLAVPWNVEATVSGGQVVKFLPGSLPEDGPAPKLLEEHAGLPIGIVTERVSTDEGLMFVAKVAESSRGNDAMVLLTMGAIDSVSVGAEPIEFKFDKNGTMVVSSAKFVELSLVTAGAFQDAKIYDVAAARVRTEQGLWLETPDEETPTPTPTPEPTESEDDMSETPETVEATVPTPIFATAKKEFKMPSAGEWISAQLQGGAVAAEFNARLRAAAPDVVTGDLDGIMPLPIVSPVYNNFQGRRPLIDATSVRAMPQSGAIFIRPVVTTHSTIGTATQNTQIQQSAFVVTDVQIAKTIQGGYVEISEASLDWSQPEVLSALLDDMARVYADRTDLIACSELDTGLTNTQNFSNASINDPAYWVEWMYEAAADILTNSNGNLPSVLAASPNVFKFLGKLSDTADRPLFPQVGPMNAFGTMSPGSDTATAFGMRVVVDRNITSAGMYVFDPSCLENWEQQKGAISVEMPSQLSRQIAFRGYFASKVIDASKGIKAAFVA